MFVFISFQISIDGVNAGMRRVLSPAAGSYFFLYNENTKMYTSTTLIALNIFSQSPFCFNTKF
jgi:hypothetical protein